MDVEKWGGKVFYIGQADTVNQWKDRIVNSLCAQWSAPAARVTELATQQELKMIPLGESAIPILLEQGFLKATVKAGSPYKWVTEDIKTVGTANGIMCVASTPDEVAYAVAKAMFEQKEYLVSAHVSFAGVTVEETLTLAKVVPLHPGAEKYYREIGALK